MSAAVISSLRNWREHLTPVSQLNDFKETGQLSPEAFVIAGDYLVHQFPTWSWQTGDKNKLRDFLPPDKQYLLTKNIACAVRADSLESETQEDTEDGFVNTYSSNVDHDVHSIPDITQAQDQHTSFAEPLSVTAETPLEDLPDMDQLALPDDDDEEAAAFASNIVSTRTYDLYITYDKYYRTPRMWLFGWSESGIPLGVKEVWQDISGDHVGKTVTMETFPHSATSNQMASVHPCKHSSVMKVFIERADGQAMAKARKNKKTEDVTSEEDGIRVDQYLIIFLKFIATITPTIEHESGAFYL